MSLKCVANVIDKKSVFPIEVKCEKLTIYSMLRFPYFREKGGGQE